MKAKYELNDTVEFRWGDDALIGTVYVVDRHGVFEDPHHVYYDILCEYHNSVCKHVVESDIIRKVEARS